MRENTHLADYSRFKIGGPARYFTAVRTIHEMQEAIAFAQKKECSFLVLGKGSNCLFDDRGFAGLVIHNQIDHLVRREERFTVGAGYSFARLGKQSARFGYSGLEFASGIPATVGGAIFMNAGANGCETKDVLAQVTFVDSLGEVHIFEKEELEFSYRHSSFHEMKGAIVEASFVLQKNEQAKATLQEMVGYRLKTQPYSEPSCGCIFRNPPGGSAGELIERLELKGMQQGGAMISPLHANFIVNTGKATADDVRKLIEKIKQIVYAETGITLEEELRTIDYEFPR